MASRAGKIGSPFASGPWGAFAISKAYPTRSSVKKLFAAVTSGKEAGKGGVLLAVLVGIGGAYLLGVGYREYERLSYQNDVLAVKNAALQREIAATQREIAAARSRWIQWPTKSAEGPRTSRFFFHP